MSRALLKLFIIAILSLTACSGATPANNDAPVAAKATHTATPAPTVSIPTATPTQAPPTLARTPTRPAATVTPLPTATPHIYVVKKFDTLLGIAIEVGTTVEALAAANGMHENDFLQIGQELVIPISTADEMAVPVGDLDIAGKSAASKSGPLNEATTTPTGNETTTVAPQTPAHISETGPVTSAAAAPSDAGQTAATAAAPAAAVPAPAGPPPPLISHPPNINPLTGLPVDDPAKVTRRPLMVRIGNDVGARQSQVGLNSADMVYEEITEWWVTRFTAIYLAEIPDTIGPVRSARLINVQLTPQYQGALAHSGGSDAVRWEISQAPIANLDEYYNPAPYFYRPGEGWQTRLAINAKAARNYLTEKNLDAPITLQGFWFSDAIDKGEPGENLYIPYPRATSFTEWHYDGASGKYLRWINSSPLYDVNGGQIAATNVIIYFAEHQETNIIEDANGATSIRIIVNGRGPAWFFRDGRLNKGFWETDGARTPYFAYEDGSPYSLKPGNTWVEVVPSYFKIGLNSADEASSKP